MASRWSVDSTRSVLSIGSFESVLSIGSSHSVLSIGSTACIGSIGSFASVGSVGSAASQGSLGSFGCRRSVGSALSVGGLVSWRHHDLGRRHLAVVSAVMATATAVVWARARYAEPETRRAG